MKSVVKFVVNVPVLFLAVLAIFWKGLSEQLDAEDYMTLLQAMGALGFVYLVFILCAMYDPMNGI